MHAQTEVVLGPTQPALWGWCTRCTAASPHSARKACGHQNIIIITVISIVFIIIIIIIIIYIIISIIIIITI